MRARKRIVVRRSDGSETDVNKLFLRGRVVRTEAQAREWMKKFEPGVKFEVAELPPRPLSHPSDPFEGLL